MKVYNVVQGSPEWHALRARHRCASEAPVMMGCNPDLQRTELVRMKSTGDEREFSAWVQEHLLARGHAVEDFARTVLEEKLGEDLYPATIGDDEEYLLASYDGITMDGETGFECKLWNEELAAAVREGVVPPKHHWQLDQQIHIAGLKRVLFVTTDGTRERFLQCEYAPHPERMGMLLPAWRQFDEDVKAYVHVEVIPKATPTQRASLPAVVIDVGGDVTLKSNLPALADALRSYIASIPVKPATDEDFANCEQAVKDLQTAQDRLEVAADAALAKFTSVEEMRSAVAEMITLARETRLRTEKVVTARKQEIRDEIRRAGAQAFAEHIGKLNERLDGYMPPIQANFPEVMKGKKTVTSLRDAVNTELARLKIEASEVADRIGKNLALVRAQPEFLFLFADLPQQCQKPCDHFALLVTSRIQAHKTAEEKRLAEERERMRLEEEAKARAKVEAEQAAAKMTPAPAAMTPSAVRETPARVAVIGNAPGALGEAVAVGLARAASKPSRPTDDEIVCALATHFNAPKARVLDWLEQFDALAWAQAQCMRA